MSDPMTTETAVMFMEQRDEWRRISAEQQADYGLLQDRVDVALCELSRLETDLSSLYWHAEGEGPQEPPEHLTESLERALEALRSAREDKARRAM